MNEPRQATEEVWADLVSGIKNPSTRAIAAAGLMTIERDGVRWRAPHRLTNPNADLTSDTDGAPVLIRKTTVTRVSRSQKNEKPQ